MRRRLDIAHFWHMDYRDVGKLTLIELDEMGAYMRRARQREA